MKKSDINGSDGVKKFRSQKLFAETSLAVFLSVCAPLSQGEPEPFEETNVDRLMSSLGYGGGSTGTGNSSLGVKAHRGSDSSTLSSQPSIDEVRSQMHMLLGNAFSLALPDHDPPSPPAK